MRSNNDPEPEHAQRTEHTMKSTPMRRQIAITAARLIAEDGIDDYGFAKRKAARQLGANPKESLPNNSEIEEALRDYQAIYEPEEQQACLLELRQAALPLMAELSEFRPYLTDAVLDGNATRFSPIELQLFADSAKDVELFLLNRDVEFESREPRRPERHLPETTLRLYWHDIPVELAVYPYEAERSRHRDTHNGRSRDRLGREGVKELIELQLSTQAETPQVQQP